MGGKQSTAARSRGPFPGVSTDDSAVPPPGGAPHFGHYRAGGGAMGLRSRSVSSVAGMGMDPSTAGGVSFGLYTPASRGTGDSERAPGGGGSASDSTYAHGNGYQETGGGHHRDGMLYLGSRASLADALPLHIAPRWFSSHSGKKCKQSCDMSHPTGSRCLWDQQFQARTVRGGVAVAGTPSEPLHLPSPLGCSDCVGPVMKPRHGHSSYPSHVQTARSETTSFNSPALSFPGAVSKHSSGIQVRVL
uniref:RING-type E3 ubiquitin transferase n=1 Tax=Equus caballus TaxID=9796 RepID=A0A3Q2H106_HORSE